MIIRAGCLGMRGGGGLVTEIESIDQDIQNIQLSTFYKQRIGSHFI